MSAIVKRSVAIRGHRTSISLEKPFLTRNSSGSRASAALAVAALVAEIDEGRAEGTNLSSAIRLFVLEDFRARQRP